MYPPIAFCSSTMLCQRCQGVGSVDTSSCCHTSRDMPCTTSKELEAAHIYFVLRDGTHPVAAQFFTVPAPQQRVLLQQQACKLILSNLLSKCSWQSPYPSRGNATAAEGPVAPLKKLGSTGNADNAWRLTAQVGPEHTQRL